MTTTSDDRICYSIDSISKQQGLFIVLHELTEHLEDRLPDPVVMAASCPESTVSDVSVPSERVPTWRALVVTVSSTVPQRNRAASLTGSVHVTVIQGRV